MAKEKFDRTKRDPNFKIGDIPVPEHSKTTLSAVLTNVPVLNQKDSEVKKSETTDTTCTQPDEME